MAGRLRDLMQSASNTAAGNVSGPVDLISMLLRYGGVPVPQNAVGGSQWMAERGLTAPVQPGPWQLAGETLGLVAPIVAAAKAPQIARALLQGGENMRAPATLNPQTGAVVYHGSPHKFDKFDSGKIGTGEGAQAYGHGLYLADAPGVAKEYAGANMGRAQVMDGFIDTLPKGAQVDAMRLLNQKTRTPLARAQFENIKDAVSRSSTQKSCGVLMAAATSTK